MNKQDFEVLADFRYQLRRFLRFSEDTTQLHGVTPLQYQLMLQVKGFPGRSHASIAELAERLQARHNSVVALVSRCEALGLVARKSSEVDLRQVDVHLTPQGEACIGKLARMHRREIDAIAQLLGQLVDASAEVST